MNKLLSQIFGSIYFDKNLIFSNKKVLHLTDTPVISYRAIIKFIKKIRPEYVIHTGDLVDNIKLEIYPNKLDIFKMNVKKFIQELENIDTKLYIVIGNHDNYEFLNKITKNATIIKKSELVKIEGKNFLLVHDLKDVFKEKEKIEKSDYILYGHTYYNNEIEKKEKFLNGLESINLIYPELNKIQKYEYPLGTDDSRMKKFRIGM